MAPKHSIVVAGASAGGVEAMTSLVHGLPRDFPAALFVTVHIPSTTESRLARVLGRRSALPVATARDGEPIQPGHVYVAPADCHLLVRAATMAAMRGPAENGNRPAIDPMFRSAAVAHGPRVIGVVLTGNLDDGTAGLLAIKRRGGLAVVQDPAEARFPSMPASAVRWVAVDHVAPLTEIPVLLDRLVRQPARRAPDGGDPDDVRREDA